jgi:tetratricopeptide (TPR) repeat protein
MMIWLSRTLFLLPLTALLFGPFLSSPALAGTAEAPEAAPGWAVLDEDALQVFQALKKGERKDRSHAASSAAEIALKSSAATGRLEALKRAVELDPSEPLHWLALGETCRLMGSTPAALAALNSGRSLFPGTRGDHRKQCIREYALSMGWIEYEAGRWSEAEAWGAKAREFDAGLDGLLIELLGMAARSMKQTEFDLKQAQWLPFANNSSNRRSNAHYCMMFFYHLHNYPFDVTLFTNPRKRLQKTEDQTANIQRWRDYGLMCEYARKFELAESYYQMSRAAHPLAAGGWLDEHSGRIPGSRTVPRKLPFWTNAEGFYVTGSLAAYAEYVVDRLADPAQSERQEFWTQRLMATAAACRHRYPNYPYRYYWRAMAYEALGKPGFAQEELFTGRDLFQKLNMEIDPRFDPLEGHVLLLRKKYNEAKPLLQAALQNFPEDPRCWAELGIILAAEDSKEEARHAFDTSLSLEENQPAVWYNRGILSSREEKWQASIDDLKRAADLAPADEQIQLDLERITKHYQYLKATGQ